MKSNIIQIYADKIINQSMNYRIDNDQITSIQPNHCEKIKQCSNQATRQTKKD